MKEWKGLKKQEHVCKVASLRFALPKNSIVHSSPVIRAQQLIICAKHGKFWNLGPLTSHLLAFQAPCSKHWSGGRQVCHTCFTDHVLAGFDSTS